MKPRPSSRLQQLLIWLMMFFSIGMYYVVVKLVEPTGARDNPMLVHILLVVAVAMVAASFAIKSSIVGTGANAASVQQLRMVVALVFCEAAALLGLVVWFVTGWEYYYVFLLLGAVGQLLHYPGGPEEG